MKTKTMVRAMNDNDELFEQLRRLAGDPVPSAEEEQRAWTMLQHMIAGERPPGRRARWRLRLVPVVAAAAVLLVVAGVLVTRPNPVDAALGDIAEAARLATPQEIPEGSFVYTRSETIDLGVRPGSEFGLDREWVAYLLPTTREIWRRPDAGFEQLRLTARPPVFFDSAVETAYYAHRLDETDHVGETVTQQLAGVTNDLTETDWPTDPKQLGDALEAYAAGGGSRLPVDIDVFHLAASLLREADPGPELRAALIEVFTQLPVELIDRTPDGTVTLAVTYNQPHRVRDTITLDAQGHLIAETSTVLEPIADLGVPAATQIVSATYTVPTVVDTLDTTP